MRSLNRRLLLFAGSVVLAAVGCASPFSQGRVGVSAPPNVSPEVSSERLLATAELFARQERWEEAEKLYSSLLDREPSHEKARQRLQYVARHLGRETRKNQLIKDVTAGDRLAQTGPSTVPTAPVDTADELPETTSAPPVVTAAIEDSSQVTNRTVETPAVRTEQTNFTVQVRLAATEPASDAQPESLVELCPDADGHVLELIGQLDSPTAETRKKAVRHLAWMGAEAKAAVPALLQVINDDEPVIRAFTAKALWSIEGRTEPVVSVFIELLSEPQPAVRQLAAYVLGTMGPKASEALPELRRAMKEQAGLTCIYLSEATARIDPSDRESIGILIENLQNDDKACRLLAAHSLGSLDSQEHCGPVVRALASALHDRDAEIRTAAALSLGSYGLRAKQAVPDLTRMTSDENELNDTREAAVIALKCIDRQEVSALDSPVRELQAETRTLAGRHHQ